MLDAGGRGLRVTDPPSSSRNRALLYGHPSDQTPASVWPDYFQWSERLAFVETKSGRICKPPERGSVSRSGFARQNEFGIKSKRLDRFEHCCGSQTRAPFSNWDTTETE